LEPIALLTYAAALTQRLRLGTAVLITAVRSRVHLAKSLATLDRLSGGRLIVGVGLGDGTKHYGAYGLPPERRVRRFTEGIQLMKRLWSEPRVSHAGDFATLENAALESKPVQRPHPPIRFGGHHPAALRRAIELGDGFMGAGSSSTEQFRKEVQMLRDLLREMGRDPSGFPIGKRVYLAVDRDRDRAQRRLIAWFVSYYGDMIHPQKCAIHSISSPVQREPLVGSIAKSPNLYGA
jgi:probable F420-dependent oxidoreductase